VVTNNPILYPQVTSIPGSSPLSQEAQKPAPGEFDRIFDRATRPLPGSHESPSKAPAAAPNIQTKPLPGVPEGLSRDLSQVKEPLKFSAHATQRLKDRNISIDQEMMGKLSRAIDQAEAKGLEDALVLSDKAAFIVSVKNKTVVTALERGAVNGNVFTNIDGAVVV